MENFKDKLSNYAALLGVFSGIIFGIESQGVILPNWLRIAGVVMGSVSVGIIGYLTGKTPAGNTPAEK